MEILDNSIRPICGRIVFLAGFSGSGKTRLLESLHQKAETTWAGNLLFVPSPSRLRDARPRKTVRKAEPSLEQDGTSVEEHSGTELSRILVAALREGSLGRGSLLLIDDVEAGMHPGLQKRMAETLVALVQERDLALVVTSHSVYFLRALEETGAKVEYYRMEEGRALCVTDRTEVLYRDFFRALEEL